MSDIAIKVENLGKKFLIGHQVEGDLRGSFAGKVRKLLGSSNGQSREEFWALKNISFEIKKGEAVGIIGRNGAGKSTLLKILSRITDPTMGRFEINGRVSSLLEVGTGFHSELTGRENIYLNGTILGMRRAEIKKKFDAIVDFSGVEKFIDTPVKHYSSGMKVRLAFSVAAHLEPEILIIDEVLAVGDAEFQKKCLGKMDEVSKNEGRTVLFVSHNMAAISNLCSHGIFFHHGMIKVNGDIELTIKKYLSMVESLGGVQLADRLDRQGNGMMKITLVEILDLKDQRLNAVSSGDQIKFRFWYEHMMDQGSSHFRFDVGLNDSMNNRVAWFSTELTSLDIQLEVEDRFVDLLIDDFPFNQGKYSMTLYSSINGDIADWVKDAFVFYVEAGDFYKNGKTVIERQGPYLVKHKFNVGR